MEDAGSEGAEEFLDPMTVAFTGSLDGRKHAGYQTSTPGLDGGGDAKEPLFVRCACEAGDLSQIFRLVRSCIV